MERFERSKLLYTAPMLCFIVSFSRLFCWITFCRTVTLFSSRFHECMDELRLRPIMTHFFAVDVACSFFDHKMYSPMTNPVDGLYTYFMTDDCISCADFTSATVQERHKVTRVVVLGGGAGSRIIRLPRLLDEGPMGKPVAHPQRGLLYSCHWQPCKSINMVWVGGWK